MFKLVSCIENSISNGFSITPTPRNQPFLLIIGRFVRLLNWTVIHKLYVFVLSMLILLISYRDLVLKI